MLSFAQATDALDKLIDRDQDFRLLGTGFGFTEGPAWNTPGNYLVFSDIPGDRRWRWSEQGGMELVAWPTYKGNGMAYEPDGSLLVCEQVTSSLIRIRPDGLRQVVAFHYQGKYLNSPNDVIVRSDGNIYFTDPNYGRWPVAVGVARECELDFQGVFRVPPGGGDAELVVAEKEFEQPNGLCFSPDESILYVNDRQNPTCASTAGGATSGGSPTPTSRTARWTCLRPGRTALRPVPGPRPAAPGTGCGGWRTWSRSASCSSSTPGCSTRRTSPPTVRCSPRTASS